MSRSGGGTQRSVAATANLPLNFITLKFFAEKNSMFCRLPLGAQRENLACA
jgi:hypothetical protein